MCKFIFRQAHEISFTVGSKRLKHLTLIINCAYPPPTESTQHETPAHQKAGEFTRYRIRGDVLCSVII
ncbi:hypothetical protein D9M71_500410 [compost metagenome]